MSNFFSVSHWAEEVFNGSQDKTKKIFGRSILEFEFILFCFSTRQMTFEWKKQSDRKTEQIFIMNNWFRFIFPRTEIKEKMSTLNERSQEKREILPSGDL